MLTAGDSTGTSVGTAQHSHTNPKQPFKPGGKSRWRIRREEQGREAAPVLHTGLFLVLELILMQNYIKEKRKLHNCFMERRGKEQKMHFYI